MKRKAYAETVNVLSTGAHNRSVFKFRVAVWALMVPATRWAAEHTLPEGHVGARLSTTLFLQKAHLQLAGRGGFSVRQMSAAVEGGSVAIQCVRRFRLLV